MKRILVIDDEAQLVELYKAYLEEFDCDVFTATDADSALDLYKTSDQPFDIIISDEIMPGKTGSQLAKEILSINPQQVIYLCSGYTNELNVKDIMAIGIKGILSKPVMLHDLLKIVDNDPD